MNTMKKMLFVGSALTASLALVACGTTSNSATPDAPAQAAPAPAAPAPAAPAPAATPTSYKIVSGKGQAYSSPIWVNFTVTPGACITGVNTAPVGTGHGNIQINALGGPYPGSASATWIAANGLSAAATIALPAKSISSPVALTATTPLNFTAQDTASIRRLSLVVAAGC